jgi:two-component system nitrogen regulation sensor histidine kinase NtrY
MTVAERRYGFLNPSRFRMGSRALFGVGYTAAAAVTTVGVWLAASAPAVGPITAASRNLQWLLGANLLLIGLLGAGLAFSVLRLVRGRVRDAGARLHLRFATLFAAAALAPAVVVALFFGLIVTRGVESWFSTRVATVVENHATVARLLLETQTDQVNSELGRTAEDLSRYAADLRRAPDAFDTLLIRQARERGFSALYVLTRSGQILARGVPGASPTYLQPGPDAFQEAEQDGTSYSLSREEDLLRVLFPLAGSPGAYVYVVAPMPEGMLDRLFESEQAVVAYREAEANSGRVQTVFVLSYVETALLVLIGAVWLGLAMATSISRPIAGLVKAADRVASGDLTARVAHQRGPSEIENLVTAFNRMTSDLAAQQDALRAASREAESRRRFIETVLAEVSAGVISVDGEGRIAAVNRQALTLLASHETSAEGQLLTTLAPEFAELAAFARRHGEAESELDLVRDEEPRRLRVRASRSAESGLVLTFDDVTKLVAAQRVAAWKDVARRIAHEIKNPLTPIQLSAERLRRKYRKQITGDLETFDRCTDTIVRQVGDIGRMVDEFSAFARMPAPRFAEEDAAELLRRAAFAQKVADSEVIVELEEPVPTLVVVDGRMIAQALTNVLKNAGEAIAARRAAEPDLAGRIQVRLEGGDEHVCFIVEDNGVGLPARGRDRLTEPYVTTREKGTGLGLAIVKRVMEDHGGEVLLQDSRELPGARAVLRFPRQGRAPALATAAE